MPKSSLFAMLSPSSPASSPAPVQAAQPPVQVSPQFRNWFLNYAKSYQGDPREQIKKLNLSPQQDQQVRAMVERLMPLMGGH